MNIDHFFTTGQEHVRQGTGCEDYALSGMSDDSARVFAVLSDGCGGANANTDVGARAICFAFEETMRARLARAGDWFDEAFLEEMKAAFALRFSMSPSPQDYLATLVGLVASPETATVVTFGDGAHLVRYADKRYRLQWLEWAGNAPFYLNYLCRPGHFDRWASEFSAAGRDSAAVECWSVFEETATGELALLEEGSRERSLAELMGGHQVSYRPQDEGIDGVTIFTDGIFRVSDVAARNAAREFTAYKNFAGAFVKRRMISALDKFAKTGNKPQDDLAVATAWFAQT
ncbi:protein phosphatase 2C domain-containing protein [Paraburkholderia sp. UCT31]|uniref:protein phosphatase 2C domain-containing protein n=1 Tax=Paraburkholderia sp. UCT31 TaxID=2615209 RepID=UPI0016564148|nr:protein phosphatase 2C domain-containing protein [Paraburkholderia sp. UCT31]